MNPRCIPAALAATVLAACAHDGRPHASSPRLASLAALAGSFSADGQARIERRMAPGMVVLARRLDPGRRPDLGGRAQGWAVLDLAQPPSLGFAALSPDEAQRVNAYLPDVGGAQAIATPFVLRATGADRERAIFCLTQAIYYEAALQPTPGQEAVAQTVINRIRHPAFPKSVCGVIYQGSQQVTGCQFSFTCDGSRQRAPMPLFWDRARAVAVQALDGFVMSAVGLATHYHADYVFPRWGPTMVKIRQIGAHIFYRYPGPAGAPESYQQRYGGDELRVSMAGPSPEAIAAAKAAGEQAQAAEPETFAMIDPSAPNGLRQRVAGEVVFGRRVPTKEEIARINASLASLEVPAPKSAASTPSKAPAPAVLRVPAPVQAKPGG